MKFEVIGFGFQYLPDGTMIRHVSLKDTSKGPLAAIFDIKQNDIESIEFVSRGGKRRKSRKINRKSTKRRKSNKIKKSRKTNRKTIKY